MSTVGESQTQVSGGEIVVSEGENETRIAGDRIVSGSIEVFVVSGVGGGDVRMQGKNVVMEVSSGGRVEVGSGLMTVWSDEEGVHVKIGGESVEQFLGFLK